jgi:hypothetical protein
MFCVHCGTEKIWRTIRNGQECPTVITRQFYRKHKTNSISRLSRVTKRKTYGMGADFNSTSLYLYSDDKVINVDVCVCVCGLIGSF